MKFLVSTKNIKMSEQRLVQCPGTFLLLLRRHLGGLAAGATNTPMTIFIISTYLAGLLSKQVKILSILLTFLWPFGVNNVKLGNVSNVGPGVHVRRIVLRNVIYFLVQNINTSPFVKPCDILNLVIQNVFYVQSYMLSALNYNPVSTVSNQWSI